ncbi:aldehyde dehydrogenase family protein [Xenorhabdus thuongxuanensis]|uniref:Methylmalonate-semialdehyde dehydrogenase n=1 Tax=Xenorhabdus thuongxuanensis TaxID=1873484 RepID=A0A1Q5U5T9_9GAMM|nr:methylmalonate-semialdehyde dehydrogenase [Xenorhabdus thuongxuanensis]
MEQIKNFIGGQLVDSQSDRISLIFNPATGQEIRKVALSTVHETEHAIESAHLAFQEWSKIPPLKPDCRICLYHCISVRETLSGIRWCKEP